MNHSKRTLMVKEIVQAAVFLVGYGNKYRNEKVSVECRFLWDEWERKGRAGRPAIVIPNGRTVKEAKIWMEK